MKYSLHTYQQPKTKPSHFRVELGTFSIATGEDFPYQNSADIASSYVC